MLLYYLHHIPAIYILFVPDVQKINGVGSKLALGATSEWVIVHAINDHLFPGTVEYMYQRSLSFTSASFLNRTEVPLPFFLFRNEVSKYILFDSEGYWRSKTWCVNSNFCQYFHTVQIAGLMK